MPIVTLRHYAGNEEQMCELEKITEQLEKATSQNPDIKFRLKLGTPLYEKIPEGVKERINISFRKLREANVSIEGYLGQGIGHAHLKAVFDNFAERNEILKPKTLFLVDTNQYDVSDNKVINAIRSISERIIKEKIAVGLALRDYVRLAEDENDDELRRLEELWHLHVCPEIKINNPQNIDTKDIYPAYLRWGDIVPGLIGFNPNLNIFGKALITINNDVQKADLTKYAGDPYVIMLLGILSKENKKGFYSEVVPTTRQTRGSRFNREVLTEKARSLKNTFVGGAYKKAVRDNEFTNQLAEYFKQENIQEARERILKGFE